MTGDRTADPESATTRVASYLALQFAELDLRWAGMFRVLLGLALLADLWRRARSLTVFFSNDGVLPNHFALFEPLADGTVSVYFSLSRPGEVAVGFALTAIVYLAFTAGFHTRLSHLIAIGCVIGLDARNLLVEDSAVTLLVALVLLSFPLPLGRRVSADALLASLSRRREKTSRELEQRPLRPARFRSLAVPALVFTWATIHLVDFVGAWGASFRDGSALHYFLQQDAIVAAPGAWLSQHAPAGLLAGLGRVGYWGLALLAALLLVPGKKKLRRRAALGVAGIIYGGLSLLTALDLLAWVRLLPFVLLLGADDIRLLGRWFGRPGRARTVIFDADCGICLLTCRILARLDPFRRLRFVGNDEDERIPAAVDRDLLETSVVVIDAEGRVWSEERAVVEIGRALPFGIFLLGWLGIPGLAALGRRGYRAIADHRIAISSWLGLGACGVARSPAPTPAAPAPDRPSAKLGVLGREVLSVVLLLVVASAVTAESSRLGAWTPPAWAATASRAARLVGLAGRLGPEPPREDGRLVVDATLPDGSHLDLLTGQAPRLDAAAGPPLAPLWAAYTERLRRPRYRHQQALFRDWLLFRQEPKPKAVTVWWVRDALPKPGGRAAPPLPAEKVLSFSPRAPSPGLSPGDKP